MNNRKNVAGNHFDTENRKTITQPRTTLTGDEETVVVVPADFMASQASVASVAAVAAGASSGTIGSQPSVAQRFSFATESSQGTVAGAASYGSVASISSQASEAGRSSRASQGTVATSALSFLHSISAVASVAGPVFIDLPAQSSAENVQVVFNGASGVTQIQAADAATMNGIARRSIDTQHQVDYMIPTGTDWKAKTL